MNDHEKVKGEIISLLRSSTKGMTISEISHHIGLNRNSTAKYLDVLLFSGQIDVVEKGKARIFHPSHRIPLSALLNFSNVLVMLMDQNLKIHDVSDNLASTFKVKKDMLIDVRLEDCNLPMFTSKEMVSSARKALKGEMVRIETEIALPERKSYFQGRMIPSTLWNGRNGVTLILEDATEKKISELRVKENEERLRELVENQGEGVVITDVQGYFTFANPAAHRKFGVPDGQLVGKNFHEFLSHLGRDVVDSIIKRDSHQVKENNEIPIILPDGAKRVLLFTFTPRFDRDGRYIGMFGVFRDITRLKEVEANLRESEERYRTLFESSPESIMILDKDRIVDCNRATLNMFGFGSVEEIIGLSPAEFSPSKQKGNVSTEKLVKKWINEVMTEGHAAFEWTHKKMNGEVFPSEIWLHTVYLNGKKMIQAIARDITDLKNAQASLEAKEMRLQNILRSLHEAFIGIVGPDLTFEEFWGTKELDERYGIRSETLKGTKVGENVLDHDLEGIAWMLQEVRTKKTHYRIEAKVIMPNGQFWHELTFLPLKEEGPDNDKIIMFGRDVTVQHSVSEELKRTQKLYTLIDTNIKDVIWITDRNLRSIYISSSVKGLTGFTQEETMARTLDELVAPPSRDKLSKVIKDLRQRSGLGEENRDMKIEMELGLIRKDGHTQWADLTMSVLLDPEGKQVGFLGVVRDASQRKRLGNDVQRFSIAFQQMKEPILIVGLDGRILEINPSALSLFGYSDRTELVGRSGFELLRPIDIDKAKKEMVKTASHLGSLESEYLVKRLDGEEWKVRTSASFLKGENGDPFGFVVFISRI